MSTEGAASESDSQEGEVALQDLIMGFLSTHRFLHQFRLQKLIYLAELMYFEKHNKRLSDSEYRPYMYGAYSDDVDEALSELKSHPGIKTETSHRYDGKKTSYSADLEPDLPDDVHALIQAVTNVTRKMSSEDLAEWSKSTYLFEETDFNDEMKFKEYKKRVDSGEIEADWKRLT